GGAGPAAGKTEAWAAALEEWVEAVRTHEPGRPDAAAAHVASWSYARRVELNPGMQRFLTMLLGNGPVVTRTPQQEEIRTLVRRTRSDPGISAFIRRAAILHTDTALFAADLPEPPDDEPAAPLVDSRAAAAPLLSTDRHILHADGRIVGERPGNWNWGFARSLLDNLFVHDRAFVAE